MREETFAITARFGSTAPVSSTRTSSENGYSLSLTTKGALTIIPAGALLLLDSWHSPRNPALRSPVSPISDAGCAESVCCPGSAAKFRDDHESAQTRPWDKFWNRMGFVATSVGPVTKNCPITLAPKLCSSCTVFWNVTVAGIHPYRSRRHL